MLVLFAFLFSTQDDDKKNMSKEVKGIEMFLAREEDINVRHDEEEHRTIAGSKGSVFSACVVPCIAAFP